ncbi:MAG: tetratricopeptide repeat protein [Lacibacter sp.]
MAQVQGWSQYTAGVQNSESKFRQAEEYFLRQQYSLALPLLLELEQELQSPAYARNPIQAEELKFYLLACRLQQNDERAVAPAADFITFTHNKPRTAQLAFHLANYYFRRQDFYNALQYYEKATIANLSNEEIALSKFRMGYCLFTLKRFREAKPLFNTIRQMPADVHYLDANYYYGFIAYADREYNDALTSFERVQQHPHYGTIVPFYLASIYYYRGQKDKAIGIAEEALRRKNVLYELEMKQLLGHAYFEKNEYLKAQTYLEEYVKRSEKVSREDVYELSYSYYSNRQYAKAIEGFRQLSGSTDSLSQSAMYMLGDAYLKTGDRENARNAFAFCAANSSNQRQREVSLFNYAKLSYELGYQGVAIAEMKRFLNEYPNSAYNREARELLVGLLAGTNNFKDALNLIESLPERSEATRRLYPRILYGRAAELINDQQLGPAEALLDKVLQDPYNAPVLPLAQFWKGEIAWRNNRIDDAIRYMQLFLQSGSRGAGEATPREANYNLGYAYMRRENFQLALTHFQKVVGRATVGLPALEQDAWLRQADCYYMLRNYRQALALYQQVIDYSWPNADYALYQKAIINGITSSRQKIEQLTALQRIYPNSSLVTDARMEIAKTYMSDEKFREAIPYLEQVVQTPGANEFRAPALFQLGVAWYNLNKNDQALAEFKKLVQQYPNTPEAADALDNIRSIFIEQGRPDAYEDFVRSTGRTVTVSEADSLAWAAVEMRLAAGDCNAILQQTQQYLARFPDGRYALEAHYNRSECYVQRKDWKNALTGYEYILQRGNSRFAERAAFVAARTYFFELQDYAKAQPYYEQLGMLATTEENRMESLRGNLRCLYRLKEFQKAAEVARQLLATKNPGTDDRALANLVTGRNQQINRQYDAAIQSFRTVVQLNKGEWAAEARYEIARCLYDLNNLANAEKAAFEVINKSGSYDYWVTKAYLLLGDIFWKQKDYFNAKATFQSVYENATNAALKAEAQEKLARVMDEEKRNSKIDG